MEKTRHILAINVGSTSTKVAFYRDSERLVQEASRTAPPSFPGSRPSGISSR